MQDRPLERSQRVVQVQANPDGTIELASAMGVVPNEQVENLGCFRPQLNGKDFLLLERRAPEHFKILGIVQKGSILHEVYEIAFKHGLEFGFDESVESEVAAFTQTEIDYSDCEDLREIPFVTVDGFFTRDLDQALYIGEPNDRFAHYYDVKPETVLTAWYAIADASWFVRPGSALYREALKRGTSVYFAGMSVPMLPAAFSQGIVSLNEDVDRRALVFVMQLGSDGVCLETRLIRARIHSRAKLVDTDVSAFLADPDHHAFTGTPFAQSLINLKKLGLMRLAESRTRNVVHFNRVSLEVKLNRAKTEFVLGLDERLDVDLYNEQLSLLCNMEGAKILNRMAAIDPEVLAIFRNHEAPSIHDVDELAESIQSIVTSQNMPEIWHWNRDTQSLADYFESLPPESCRFDPDDPPEIQHLYRVRQAIERKVLMVQRRSIFSTDAGLHSALGVNPYARFSAPMREIVGIFTHKEAIEAEFDTPPALDREANAALRQRVIESSNFARNIQREVDKAIDSCAIDHAIRDDFKFAPAKRPHRRGTILGMKPSALYVRLDMPPIELKVYIRDIAEATGTEWTLNDALTELSCASGARYVVGDSIELFVSAYQNDKKKWRVLPV